MNRYFTLGFLAALAVGASGHGLAKDAPSRSSNQYPTVTAVLDYSKGREGDDPAADALFKHLDRYDGKVIALKLSIIPRQERQDPGYSLVPVSDAWGVKPKPDDAAAIVCGVTVDNGTVGVVDNFTTVFALAFQHPRHFHAPANITIGDRRHFPFQTIICTAEDYLNKALTELVITGHFLVTTAGIPTAISYVLSPFPE